MPWHPADTWRVIGVARNGTRRYGTVPTTIGRFIDKLYEFGMCSATSNTTPMTVQRQCNGYCTNTAVYYYTHLTASFPRQSGQVGTRKAKPVGIYMRQEMMGFRDGSGISWTICKQSAPRSRQITTSTPHHSIFLQAGCSS